ncbi:MAG: hypothetical protein ACLFP8_07860 [Alphaproteobacteria bacterium]
MQVKRLQSVFSWVVLLSGASHIFCCVLPSVLTALTLLVTMGAMTAIPSWIGEMHDTMHAWEIQIILLSGAVLVLGWIAHLMSRRVDCHDTGCAHEPCSPKKDKNALILKIATALFLFNISTYSVVHMAHEHEHGQHEYNLQDTHAHQEHDHIDHAHPVENSAENHVHNDHHH